MLLTILISQLCLASDPTEEDDEYTIELVKVIQKLLRSLLKCMMPYIAFIRTLKTFSNAKHLKSQQLVVNHTHNI